MMSVTDKKHTPDYDFSGLKNEPVGWHSISQETLTPLGKGSAIFLISLITGLVLYLGLR